MWVSYAYNKESQMEKITLKPIAKELLFKSDDLNTHVDVLTYGGSSNQEKALGTLFLIGHIKFEEEDLGYVISLISSLAKREYYAHPHLTPKEAFAGTLRKVNEAVEDFFKNEDLQLSVGIFALAHEQIYISRLGKFKIILARDGKNIRRGHCRGMPKQFIARKALKEAFWDVFEHLYDN